MVMEWMYSDAIFLKDANRKKGCLCLLLCLVDATSKKKYPDLRVGERCTTYLKDKLIPMGLDAKYRIEEKDELLHISDIIYEYFRCNFVHEADSREDWNYEVQIEYGHSKGFVFDAGMLMDRVHKKLIFKADWLINLLEDIFKDEYDSDSDSLSA